MNQFITFLFFAINIACTTSNEQVNNISHSEKLEIIEESKTLDEPYEIELQIEQSENKTFQLVASIELDSGTWFASPYSKESLKGYFNLSIEDHNQLVMDDAFEEIPRSSEEINPMGEFLINVVRENTVYKRNLKVLAKEDFDVKGSIRFVIEPRCTMEQIGFVISNRSGKLNVVFVDKK